VDGESARTSTTRIPEKGHRPVNEDKLRRSIEIPDLSDPTNGVHAINLTVERILTGFRSRHNWPAPLVRRLDPVTTVAYNFDMLYFPPDNAGRSETYTRYLPDGRLLRTHTSAMIPVLLPQLHAEKLDDFILFCPGICFRRDVVDRQHNGEPHQMDIWRIRKGEPRLERSALIEMVETLIDSIIPGYQYRANETSHPYTMHGIEVEVLVNDEWVEILECGEALPGVLSDGGFDSNEHSGLALGMGLDRLAMIAKGINDIRILRSQDPRISCQMLNLDPYVPVSKFPPVRHDMSVSIASEMTDEDVSEAIRDIMGDDVDSLEEVTILSQTPYNDLPPQAIERLVSSPVRRTYSFASFCVLTSAL